MDNLEDMFKSLSSGCIKILLYMMDKKNSLSPSTISIDINVDRRKVGYCLNNLVKNGLVTKLYRGAYKISKKGFTLINLLSSVSGKENIIVWTDKGFISFDMDFLNDLLGDVFPKSQLPRIFHELNEGLFPYGIISLEHLVTYLCHILFKEGYDDLCHRISRKILFFSSIESENKASKYRKLLESSIIGHSTILLKENIMSIDDAASIDKNHVVFMSSGKKSYLLDDDIRSLIRTGKELVINIERTDLLDELFRDKCLFKGIHITVNLHEDNFTPEVNDSLRIFMNNMDLSVAIRFNGENIIRDELLRHILYNNIKHGMKMVLAKEEYYSNRILSKDGFSCTISNNIDIINIIIRVNMKFLLNERFNRIFLENGIPTILRYKELKRKLNPDFKKNTNTYLYLLLNNLNDIKKTDKKDFAEYVRTIKNSFEEQHEKNIIFGLEESVYDEDMNTLFIGHIHPLPNIIIDVDDLRYTLMKFYRSKYPLIYIFSRT